MIWNPCRDWRGFFLVLGGASRFHSNFTDKALFLADLSVSKTHFTDKPSFSGDLSVNFWPLWWGFTDKTGCLERLSVKPGQKRLNFYGQTAVFDHFVRNRHFSRRPITDKVSIFIDLSVNGGKRQWFCQMQCCASSAQSLHLTSVTGKTLISEIRP